MSICCHKKILILTTFLMGVPIIYEYHMHPLMGFALAFLFSWMIWEDYETELLDIRAMIAFGLLAVIFRSSWMATETGVFFVLLFQCLRYGFVKFEHKMEPLNDELCQLQPGCFTGFIPLLGASAWLFWMTDMIFDPLHAIFINSTKGSPVAQHLVQLHAHCKEISQFISSNQWIFPLILLALLLLLLLLRRRIQKKEAAGLHAVYPMGDGDPYVMGGLAVLCGAEAFFYVVLMGSLILGELLRVYYTIRKNRGIAHE